MCNNHPLLKITYNAPADLPAPSGIGMWWNSGSHDLQTQYCDHGSEEGM